MEKSEQVEVPVEVTGLDEVKETVELLAQASADKLRIDYHVKRSKNYDSEGVGASWEFTLPETYDVEDEYRKAFNTVKQMVDAAVEQVVPAQAESASTIKASTPVSKSVQKRQAAQASTDEIVENEAVYYEDCRVFKKAVTKTSTGKRKATIRIGNMAIPGRYVTAETFEPQLITQIDKTVDEGDHVDVWGYFRGWSDNEERIERGEEPVYSLVIQKLEVR